MATDPAALFRAEAIEHARTDAVRGGLLRLAPPWTAALYASLMSVFLLALGTAVFGTVRIHSTGRGEIRPEAKVLSVRAPFPGVVRTLRVREGDRVDAGQELLAFDPSALFADPDRASLPEAMLTLQQSRLTIVAAATGVVDRLAIRDGSYVGAGDLLATVVPSGSRLIGYLSLPARDWPYLREGESVAVKFDAYPWQEMGVGWGRIVRVAADTEPQSAAKEPTVRVDVLVERMPDRAAGAPLSSGMAFTGEVALRTARIYELLLKPLAMTPSPPATSGGR